MTPTNYLRFVERTTYVQLPWTVKAVTGKILQQWWHINDEPPPSSRGEWRDVPVEQEQTWEQT